MGNFASSPEWVHHNTNTVPAMRQTITPHQQTLPRFTSEPVDKPDLLSVLVAQAISTCKASIHRALATAIDTLGCSGEPLSESESYSEEVWMDEVLGEFQIVYEDNYPPPSSTKPARQIQEDNTTSELFQEDTPWFQYSPSDFKVVDLSMPWDLASKAKYEDDDRSETTDSTDWFSEMDDATSETNPATSTCSNSDLDELEFYDETDDAETKATRLLRMASSITEKSLLFVDDYICQCGKCPLYATIEDDVANVAPWHGPEELLSLARILQAFSTYNEAIGYHPEMIAAADECLRIWGGDEDQAFSSFVVLYDDVPFLCASAV